MNSRVLFFFFDELFGFLGGWSFLIILYIGLWMGCEVGFFGGKIWVENGLFFGIVCEFLRI